MIKKAKTFNFLVFFVVFSTAFFCIFSLAQAAVAPNDAYYNKQWYLKKIKADIAWEKAKESPEITIAIIDSGVQINHPDLAGNIWVNKDEIPGNDIDDDKNGFIDDYNGWDFIKNIPDPSPKFEKDFSEAGLMHGTIVAGVAAAVGNNGAGVAGITWKTKIMPLRVMDDKGEGRASEVIRAVDYAVKNQADIINFSFVGFDYSRAFYEAVRRAYEAGIIMVAAAGNEQSFGKVYNLNETPMYPACYNSDSGEDMVLGVASTDAMDQKSEFSSFGSSCVDISAPGEKFFSTIVYNPLIKNGDKYLDQYYGGYWSGTSLAAPVISGAAALIEGLNPGLRREEVIRALKLSAENIYRLNPKYLGQLGSGRLDLSAAINLAEEIIKGKTSFLLLSPYSNHPSEIKKTDRNGKAISDFSPFGDKFRGGVFTASGDVDGNGLNEIIAGAGAGGGPQIRIFNTEGIIAGQFFAYDKNFRGGVAIAAGDVDGDGREEIITAPGKGISPEIKVFNNKGELRYKFLAFEKNFRGGVFVASGDVDSDNVEEIIVSSGPGRDPEIRIFDKSGKELSRFLAYDKNFRGGVRVASADINGGVVGKKDEIIVSPWSGGGPHVKIFDRKGKLLSQFFAYDKTFRGGVSVAAGDFDSDGRAEIATGAGPTGGPHIRIFRPNGELINSFYAFDKNFAGGVNIGAMSIKN